ncbi:hypothetical protein Ddye_027830 [Dipteronia dyeriana]|uniref:Uncharacterized protein n=1 Tax=Dipteronia dyeriana TaxID=168575 RepID=A0AAD9WRT6_9ROSI|nr:hypothetical protein Ddye_027830 [Dipteronia dyeriana]
MSDDSDKVLPCQCLNLPSMHRHCNVSVLACLSSDPRSANVFGNLSGINAVVIRFKRELCLRYSLANVGVTILTGGLKAEGIFRINPENSQEACFFQENIALTQFLMLNRTALDVKQYPNMIKSLTENEQIDGKGASLACICNELESQNWEGGRVTLRHWL